MDARLISPFYMGVFASILSEKSVFVKKILLQQNRIISTPFKMVIWIYKTWQHELFKELLSQTLFELTFWMIYPISKQWENRTARSYLLTII